MNAAEKCAIVMLTLGDERAAEVFKHLNTHEVTMIIGANLLIRQRQPHRVLRNAAALL